MEDPTCRVHDSTETLTRKIHQFIDVNRENILLAVSNAAKHHDPPLSINDKAFKAATYAIPHGTSEAIAEFVLPRCIIAPDEQNLFDARNRIDLVLIAIRQDPMGNDPEKKAALSKFDSPPQFTDIWEIARDCMDNVEFGKRALLSVQYKEFREAWTRLSQLTDECEALAKRKCSYGCGIYGANKKCDICCGFFCSSVCFDGHKDLNKCKHK